MSNINSAIESCQDAIRNIDGLTSSDAFDEMSKILFCLMNQNSIFTTSDVRDTFKEIYKKNPDIFQGENINLKDSTVDTILSILSEFDLFNETEDVKGRTFEKFLGRTFTGDLGQFFTPKKIVNFISKLTHEIVKKYGIEVENVYDPTCGSGGFLVDFNRIYGNNIKYYGTDINPRIISVCKRNLLAHNITNCEVSNSDFIDTTKENFFDVILTNPPFGVKEKRKDRLDNFFLSKGKREEVLEIIFIEKIIKSLKKGGIAAIVLPDGILNNSSDLFVRKYILGNCDLLASIDLPENTFKSSGTGCDTSVIFIRKKIDNNDSKTFLFYPKEVGFERKTKLAKEIDQDDLQFCISSFINNHKYFEYEISDSRFDAKYYLLKKSGNNLSSICEKSGYRVRPFDGLKKYIEFSNIDDFGFINGCDEMEYSDLPSRAKIVVKTGDLICARLKQSSDRIAIITEEYNECVVSTGFVVIRSKEFNPEFILALLKSENIQTQIKSKTTGSIMASITDDEFLSVIIPNLENIITYNETLKLSYEKLYEIKKSIKSNIKSINI
jgi:type I restriction-modification system DNA methylase subunit